MAEGDTTEEIGKVQVALAGTMTLVQLVKKLHSTVGQLFPIITFGAVQFNDKHTGLIAIWIEAQIAFAVFSVHLDSHAPSFATFTPRFCATHALLYVLPSEPQTGLYSLVQGFGDGELVTEVLVTLAGIHFTAQLVVTSHFLSNSQGAIAQRGEGVLSVLQIDSSVFLEQHMLNGTKLTFSGNEQASPYMLPFEPHTGPAFNGQCFGGGLLLEFSIERE